MPNFQLLSVAILASGIVQAQLGLRFEIASVKQSAPSDKFGVMDGGPLPPGPFNVGNHDPDRITSRRKESASPPQAIPGPISFTLFRRNLD
jgi:hypothetical protein